VENQLVRIDFPNLPVPDPQTGEPMQQVGGYAEYRYDALARRIEKKLVRPVELGSAEDAEDGIQDSLATKIARWVYDSEDILLEYEVSSTPNPYWPWWGPEYNETNVLVARYTHGIGFDEPLLVTRDANASFYHVDRLGCVTQLSRLDNFVVRSAFYEAFGKETLVSGTSVTTYGYTGREPDSESGLAFYRARHYDAHVGRFLQEDPMREGLTLLESLNAYPYVGNSPLNLIDPLGLYSWDEFLEDASNFAAGFGDNLTSGFGLTRIVGLPSFTEYVREKVGINDVVNKCSAAYTGGEIAADVWLVAVTAAGGARTVGTKTAVQVRGVPGADLATSMIVKTKSLITGRTLKVVHRVVKEGRVIHEHVKFMRFLPF
jgi:RHS repeat-associated protein